MTKLLSVIVVNRNGASVLGGEQIPDVFRHYGGKSILEGCLSALAPLTDAGDAEVLVVDNGSTDGSVDLIRGRFPSCRLLANPGNLGFAPAVVQAAAVSEGKHLLLVNSDVLIDPPRVRKLLAVMEERPRLGVLTCLTRYPGGTLQRPASRLQTPGRVLAQLMGLKTPHDDAFDASRYGEPDWVAGGVMLIRREAWDAVGGMDPGFIFYEEDADFCLRLRKAGWGVGYTPEVEVMHVRAATASLDPVFSLTHRYRSLLRYCGKHFPPGTCLLIRGVLAGRMLARAITALLRGEKRGMARAALGIAAESLTRS